MKTEQKDLQRAEEKRMCDISMPNSASIEEMIRALWRLPRDIVSDGYDAALAALSSQVPMTIHEYPTGMECFTWIIPEKWKCHEGYLETLDGKRLFSYADNPLHVVSYSLPFDGEVPRAELFQHLHVHPKLNDAIPFVFRYYNRDWGLCCSDELKRTLTDASYRVVIRTEFSHGALKVGEVVVPGESTDCIVLCAHLCHPGLVNDGLSGVVVGIDVMRKLLVKEALRYTYRLVILPETVGSAAYLSQHETSIPLMKGGLFLEMLGTPHPHALQHSYQQESVFDRCCALIVKEHDRNAWFDGFLKIVMNDERMFNAPGIRVPMASLSRVVPKGDDNHPYREYHSSRDTPESVDYANLMDSVNLILKIIDAVERNQVPVPKFKGEVFWSRFKSIDYIKMFPLLQSIPYCIDGSMSVADISGKTGLAFDTVRHFLETLEKEELIGWKESAFPAGVECR